MKLTLKCLCFAIGIVLVQTNLRAADMAELIKGLPAPTSVERDKLCADLFKEGAPGIQALCKMLAEPGKGDDAKARLALHGMAIHASRPGGDADRALYAKTIAGELGSATHSLVKAFLLTQLRLTGGDDQVAEIAKWLGDAELADPATQTLLTIRTSSVAPALRAALATVKGAPRITIINALGNIRDKDAAAAILKDAEAPDAALRNAALHALANIGDATVAPALAKAASTDDWSNRSQAMQATLTLAQRLVELGKKTEGAAICRNLSKLQLGPKESNIQCAALNILASAEADAAFDDLKVALKNESPDVRATALAIASSVPGEAVTLRWAAELKDANPKFFAEILAILERRGDPAALPAIIEATKNADKSIRVAAFHALVAGGKDALPTLLTTLGQDASKDNADELAAARFALVHLKGGGVNAAIGDAIKGASLNLRKALIGALAERGAVEQIAILTAATVDTDASIRATAFDSVGFLGGIKELGALLSVIQKTESDDDRNGAEKAASTIASRIENKAASVPQVAAALAGASVKAKQALLRVLAKIGGADALAALKPLLKDASSDVSDTAIRELANWPDESAEAELLDIAKNDTDLKHNVLAINGYVRLVGQENKRASNEQLPKLKAALELCRRPDEKKKVISGIQNVKTKESALLVEELMADPALREEACNALMNIGKDFARHDKDAARKAFEKVIATTQNAGLKKNAQAELEKLGK